MTSPSFPVICNFPFPRTVTAVVPRNAFDHVGIPSWIVRPVKDGWVPKRRSSWLTKLLASTSQEEHRCFIHSTRNNPWGQRIISNHYRIVKRPWICLRNVPLWICPRTEHIASDFNTNKLNLQLVRRKTKIRSKSLKLWKIEKKSICRSKKKK